MQMLSWIISLEIAKLFTGHGHWLLTNLLKELMAEMQNESLRDLTWLQMLLYPDTDVLFLSGHCLMTSIMLLSHPSFKWLNLCVFFLPLVAQCELVEESILKGCLVGARLSLWMVAVVSEPLRWSSMETGQASSITLVGDAGSPGKPCATLVDLQCQWHQKQNNCSREIHLLKCFSGSRQNH